MDRRLLQGGLADQTGNEFVVLEDGGSIGAEDRFLGLSEHSWQTVFSGSILAGEIVNRRSVDLTRAFGSRLEHICRFGVKNEIVKPRLVLFDRDGVSKSGINGMVTFEVADDAVVDGYSVKTGRLAGFSGVTDE
ncbi:hypothetical protein JCM9743_25250 [Natrinema sp. JCM 9743]